MTTFNANIDQFLVGYTNAGGTANYPSGTVYLAQNNTITASNGDDAFCLGRNSSGVTSTTPGYAGSGTVYLGQTNVLRLAGLSIGRRQSSGYMAFNPAFSGSKSLSIRGTAGGTARINNILIGDDTSAASGDGHPAALGVLDLRGGTVDIMANNIILGRTSTVGGTSGTHNSPGDGTLYFDAGTIDTTLLQEGYNTRSANAASITSAGQYATGTVNVSGTANLVVTNLELARFWGGTWSGTTGVYTTTPIGGWSSGTLNISGGTVTVANNITANPITTTTARGRARSSKRHERQWPWTHRYDQHQQRHGHRQWEYRQRQL